MGAIFIHGFFASFGAGPTIPEVLEQYKAIDLLEKGEIRAALIERGRGVDLPWLQSDEVGWLSLLSLRRLVAKLLRSCC